MRPSAGTRAGSPRRTRRLVVEEGGFLYDSDSYADKLPYWVEVAGSDHLVIPYTPGRERLQVLAPERLRHRRAVHQYLVDSSSSSARRRRTCPSGCTAGSWAAPGEPRARSVPRAVHEHDHVWVTTRAEIARPGVRPIRRRSVEGHCVNLNRRVGEPWLRRTLSCWVMLLTRSGPVDVSEEYVAAIR